MHIFNRCFFFLLILTYFPISSCRDNRSKERLDAVFEICNRKLFVEKYIVAGGGAYGGDMTSAYLTDSTNFRKYVLTYDNAKEGLAFECHNDDITVSRKLLNTATNKFEIVETFGYNILKLKDGKKFE